MLQSLPFSGLGSPHNTPSMPQADVCSISMADHQCTRNGAKLLGIVLVKFLQFPLPANPLSEENHSHPALCISGKCPPPWFSKIDTISSSWFTKSQLLYFFHDSWHSNVCTALILALIMSRTVDLSLSAAVAASSVSFKKRHLRCPTIGSCCALAESRETVIWRSWRAPVNYR